MPAVPPPSQPIALRAGFPAVPPPSPSLPVAAGADATPVAAAPAAPKSDAAAARAQREADSKVKKEIQAAQEREAKAQRDLAAAKKAGKAPASAYATAVIVEVPKTFTGKDAELQELLILYKAGQVSPEDYHKKRAAIVARP